MESDLEVYLAKKGIKYEKLTDSYFNYYILERFVEFDDIFDFMARIVDKNALLGNDENVKKYLNDLDKNNIKYKEVLQVDKVDEADKDCLLYLRIQCEIEDITFCFSYFNSLNYEHTKYEYEFRKFIKYNTTFDLGTFTKTIHITTDKLNHVMIYNNDSKIHLRHGGNSIVFTQFQDFEKWLAKNMPEYLQNHDIKIALKN